MLVADKSERFVTFVFIAEISGTSATFENQNDTLIPAGLPTRQMARNTKVSQLRDYLFPILLIFTSKRKIAGSRGLALKNIDLIVQGTTTPLLSSHRFTSFIIAQHQNQRIFFPFSNLSQNHSL